MLRRKIAGLASILCLIASIPVVPVSAADNSYDMQVTVNLAGEKKAISPYIYGVNEYGSGNLKTVTTHNARQGGNRYTGYNWETNWSNAGEDWQHSSDTNIGDLSDGTAFAARHFSETCEKYNIPYKLATLQMAGYVSADKNGTVSADEAAPSARWNKVEFRKDGELSLEPDLTDGTVYMDEYVNFLVKTLGDAGTSTGIQAYSLDNEPVLWNDTHPLLHANEVTNEELVSKSIELAKVVKEIDPKAEVFGPAFWGMLPCVQIGESGNGFTDPDWQAVKNDYNWYLDYYLKQMADAEKEAGTRLLDVIDVHYYAQDCATDEARLQAARSLYDPDYVENSWLQPWCGKYFPFLPNIQESIDKYYPNTKIAVSEYNLANIADEKNTGKSVVAGIAETEALGAFAKTGVYFATYWGTMSECPYVASGINLYTNYDGEGASFGDTLVEANTTDLSKAAAFASINGNDDSTVTMTLSNKDMTNSEKAVISLDGTSTNYKSAVVYAITQDNSDIRIIDVQNDLSGNKITVELPPLSVAQIVISDKATDKTTYEAPDITTKEVSYQMDELENSANGFPMIPLGDKEHLKKIVINATASSNEGSSYGGGGGGLCFNKVVRDGSTSEEWGSKAVNFALGTADIEIPFDGEFTVVKDAVAGTNETITGTTNDEYAEFQGGWWKYSEKQPDGSDITVTYNSVTLVYEYDGTTPVEPTETTEPTPTESDEPTSEPDDSVTFGDVDGNGEVNIVDVLTLNQYLLGVSDSDEVNQKNADVDKDGTINDTDAMNILKSLVNLVTLPVEK